MRRPWPPQVMQLAIHTLRWSSIDDVVMGGVSSSHVTVSPDGPVLFEGTVSLENNGGFASIRAALPAPLDASTCSGLIVTAIGDGRTYRLRLHDRPGADGIAWQAEFATADGESTTSELPFASFEPTFRGRRPVGVSALDTSRIVQVGLMIARQPGPFRLELRSVRGAVR